MQDTTIYTIAEKAGCSASTVSRVINNYPYVKKATRTKVLKLLQEYKYVPNETARSLVNRSTRIIGILISDIRTTHHTDGVYYIQQELSKYGYSCLIYNTGRDMAQQSDYIHIMSQRKVDGVIMMGSIYQNEAVRNAIVTYFPDIPVVICNGYLDCPNVYGIITDEDVGISNICKLLSERGKKYPVIIADHITPSNQNKIQGYKDGMSKYFPGVKPIVSVTDSGSRIYEETLKVINENPQVDAIIYTEDFIALSGLQALTYQGKKIPEDIAVAGVNNSRFSEISIPKLTSLDNMLHDTSIIAARNLLSIIKGEHVNRKMILCSEIIEKETT